MRKIQKEREDERERDLHKVGTYNGYPSCHVVQRRRHMYVVQLCQSECGREEAEARFSEGRGDVTGHVKIRLLACAPKGVR